MIRLPLPRTARLGMRGLDIEAHTAAMHRYLHDGHLAAFRKQRLPVRQTFGVGKRTLAKKAARRAGLPQYGVVGPGLYRAMWDAQAYDVTARTLLADYADSQTKLEPRARVVAGAYLIKAVN